MKQEKLELPQRPNICENNNPSPGFKCTKRGIWTTFAEVSVPIQICHSNWTGNVAFGTIVLSIVAQTIVPIESIWHRNFCQTKHGATVLFSGRHLHMLMKIICSDKIFTWDPHLWQRWGRIALCRIWSDPAQLGPLSPTWMSKWHLSSYLKLP